MKCPFCQSENDKVIDSRSVEEGFAIRRRRQCVQCGKRFSTYERVAELDIRVIKRDGARETLQPKKIRQGLERACWKRPIQTEELEATIIEILQEIFVHADPEIESQEIGEIVMRRLLELDDVAYIRFASVYRQFKDVHDFVDVVRPILERHQSDFRHNN
jgi:transcriptional repressor NrdR